MNFSKLNDIFFFFNQMLINIISKIENLQTKKKNVCREISDNSEMINDINSMP